MKLDIVILGLSLSSSWGNGHATTYRALLRGLHALGHRITFLERNRPWYEAHRDLPEPDFCRLIYYDGLHELRDMHSAKIRAADIVIVGSYVPEGAAVIDLAARRAAGKFCFYDIDTPVTLARLVAGDEEFISRRQIALFDIYFSFTGGPVLQRLEKEFGARHAHALYCSADAVAPVPDVAEPEWDLGYLGTYSSDRQPKLERLLLEPARRMPDRRFVVAGSQYPRTIHWPENVERIDHLAPPQHASFYARQRFTLNLTRADMTEAGWSPSVRLFEAAASGCPIISDSWLGLDDFFTPGESIHVAETADEICSILAASGAERRAIAARARSIVLARHTGAVRARELIHCVTGLRSPGPASSMVSV